MIPDYSGKLVYIVCIYADGDRFALKRGDRITVTIIRVNKMRQTCLCRVLEEEP